MKRGRLALLLALGLAFVAYEVIVGATDKAQLRFNAAMDAQHPRR